MRVIRCKTWVNHLNPIIQRRGLVQISEDVQAAIKARKPVVALETAIYTHGFPYPENATLATDLENLVRKNKAVPATIGVLDGIPRVGFTADELYQLTASAGKRETRKLSRRDLGYICGLGLNGQKLNGGTTIAATMVLAHMAKIKILATGGLGGVHKGGENSLDISADLQELGRTPVTVISSGCKSFLDIPRTLEYLETHGVAVGTFTDGREGAVELPAFWSRDSGISSPLKIQDEKEAATIIHAQSLLSLSTGIFFANPVPEKYSIPKAQIDVIIDQALLQAQISGIIGSENTPYVLKKIRELTHGASVTANRALIEANVIRGSKVAVELANLENNGNERTDRDLQISMASSSRRKKQKQQPSQQEFITDPKPPSKIARRLSPTDPSDVLVAGALAVDFSCDFTPDGHSPGSLTPQLQTSNLANIRQSLGGVGQNIATALHYLGVSVRLCSVVAEDVVGSAALEMLTKRGISTFGIEKSRSGASTAQYIAINDAKKDLVLAMADMKILETVEDFGSVWAAHLVQCKPKWLVADANWDTTTLKRWILEGKALGSKVAYEPVSVNKSKRLFASTSNINSLLATVPHHSVSLTTPNAMELGSMYAAAREAELFEREDWWRIIDAMGMSNQGSRDKLVAITNSSLVNEGVPQQSIQLLPFIPSIVTKLGKKGVLLTQLLLPDDERLVSPASAPFILTRSDPRNKISGGVYMRLFPVAEQVSTDQILSVNGVGDTFLGALIAGLLGKTPSNIEASIDFAQRASLMTLKSNEAVSPELLTLNH